MGQKESCEAVILRMVSESLQYTQEYSDTASPWKCRLPGAFYDIVVLLGVRKIVTIQTCQFQT